MQQIGPDILCVGLSDVGCVRTLNEDNLRVEPSLGLMVVSDGMGGHDAGEVASELVVNSLDEFLHDRGDPTQPIGVNKSTDVEDDEDSPTLDELADPNAFCMREAVNYANSRVNRLNRERGYNEGTGMGATVVGMWVPDSSENAIIFHVGDSRLYLYRDDGLKSLTRDHSMYEQWKAFGSKGKAPSKNILTQAMGPTASVAPDITLFEPRPGDVLLICSDGLHGMVSEPAMAMIMAQTDAENLDEQAQVLIDLAKQAGGKDNVTVILAIVPED
ncbi:PP2C family protein-serine/threonine phosphatase [Magnetococcus sp. PR-3]|uniref:PP2C family protein-serine/threonine phosphatase n=1 Tax=Magnetococcus sp. PR-3 TaxID=3120355 RepID=UPI002FCE1553